MKPFAACAVTVVLAILLAAQPACAQMTSEQRVLDFQNLAALYAKRYAPADWKRQALGFDLFDLKPWLDRARAAKDDLEFFEIQAEYVAKLQDTHTGFQMTSSFAARLGAGPVPNLPGATFIGLLVDIYDGKVLIDFIGRNLLPASEYPFQVGDELVSVDGVSVEDWIKRLSTWRQYGNPATTRRFAANQLINRTQSVFPRAVDTPNSAVVEIRRANGALERYNIGWYKTGYPLTTVGPVPTPRTLTSPVPSGEPAYLAALEALHNYKLPDNDPLWNTFSVTLGARAPHFSTGFPSTFTLRLGRNTADFHYSGTYTSGGLTIGYLRIPSFAPPSTALAELRAEIDYMQRNTDGLVIDVTKNPGGGCYMIDAAASLIPYPFYFFGEELRPTQSVLNSFKSQLDSAKAAGAPQEVIDSYQQYFDAVKAAYEANRGMTAPVPACRQTGSTGAPIVNNNEPNATVYTKPLIVLVDELSISAADIFPAMIQDNRRALIVGARTAGGGGSVSGWNTGFYSESISTNTNSLVVRKRPITTPEFPAAPYVENIGTRPDVPLEFMTRENLLNGGRTYVDQFTQILVSRIRAVANQKTFSVANRGAVSLTTPELSGAPVVGHGRIQADGGSTTPNGLAIFGFRQNNVLVTEAAVPATSAFQSGRIYAEMSGSVNTGIAIANPNLAAVTVSFYFTGVGNTTTGSFVIPANGQIAAFLDQGPFNGARPFNGTFTFTSSLKVAAVALRSINNERGEFLITTLPVADLSRPAATGPSVSPHFADGGGWKTEVVLVNPTDSTITGTVLFRDGSGTNLTMNVDGVSGTSFTYSIPARTSQKLTTAGSAQSVQSGSVTITPAAASNAAPVVSVVFSFRQNGVTVNMAGIQAMGSASAYRLYGEASGDFDKGTAGSIETGVAITNRTSSAASVTVELFNLDGSPVGLSGNVVVPAGGQVSRFLRQVTGLASLPLPFRGVIRVSSTTAISVAGLRGRYNERNDFLITAIPPVDESIPATDDDLLFPHFVQAGGYTTQFILFAGSAGQKSSGVLQFASQAGEPLNLTFN
jgi:C-terminal processing protease CtpA/Prc